jgi:hypothetical protein
MKTTIKTICMLMIFAVTSMGMAKADDITITPTAGVNIANIAVEEDFEDLLPFETKIGFHVGAFATYPLADMFGIKGGLLFSTKGAQFEGEEEFGGETYEYSASWNLMYLDIPILFNVTPAEGISVFAGLQPSLLLSAKGTYEEDGESETEDIEDISSLDLAAVFGAGYTHESGISISASYDLGFSTLDDNGDIDMFNRVIKISLGYSF